MAPRHDHPAAEHHVSVLAATGDWGPTGPDVNGDPFPFETVRWPASDPEVTGVGGTKINMDASDARVGPDTAWSSDSIGAAGGGGLSVMFPRSRYQNGVASVVGDRFGLPTIAMNASCGSSVNIYASFDFTPGDGPGWSTVCATSEASPLVAGLVADAAALDHHPPGLRSPASRT